MPIRRFTPAHWLAAGFVLLLANTAYLAAYAEATAFYFINVALHSLGGLALAIATGWAVARRRIGTPALLAIGLTLLAVGLVLGVLVAWLGATRPYYGLLYSHILASVAGSVVVLVRLALVARRLVAPERRWLLAAIGLILLFGVAASARLARHDETRRAAYRITNPTTVPVSMTEEGAGPSSPFWPSSANTNVNGIIPANFFLTSKECGRCHKDVYEQWSSSAHHFSSFNNQWYRKSIEYMQEVIGTKPSRWCAGCHDHAMFFNGRFDRPAAEQIDTPEAQAGLGCTSCHAITHVKSTMGQGDFIVEYPPLHDLATSDNTFLRWTHDKLLALDPQPHREIFLKPFHTEQTPEFCSTCHKVHLDVPVNDYRWFRGFNDYDNWQASGISGQGARSFYYPPQPQTCRDCHMPLVESDDPGAKDGKIRSHRFPGANTALPYVNRDDEQLKVVQDFLRNGQVTVDIFGFARADESAEATPVGSRREEPQIASTFAVGEESANFGAGQAFIAPPVEVIGPLGHVDASVRRGESVRLEVVVRTRKVGHFFPGGTVDAFDVWVELEARDETGRTIFQSGQVEDGGKGPVEPGAHFYRALLIDDQGNHINKRNAWMARSVAYVRLIPPGAADTIHYRLQIPPDAGERIYITAKVNYRKFMWWNTQWAFAGERDPTHRDYALATSHDSGRWVFTADTSDVSGKIKAIPDIPITVMAEQRAELRVLPADAPLPDQSPYLDASVRERWNDYGIGLLLQGDLKGAEAAFLKVTEMEPGYADGWVNVARARIREGNLEGAEAMLRKALAVDADLAKAHFFLGTVLKNAGRYDDALAHLRKAAAQYPRDRVVRNQVGRLLFLKRRYEEAIAEFEHVLTIDPEDLQAHYNLMLCYRGVGDRDKAAREQKLYERFKADEASQALTGPYRRLHPEDNNERQPIHEHRSAERRPGDSAPYRTESAGRLPARDGSR